MAPYKYMKFRHVILLMLVTLVLSLVAMPLYQAGVAVWDRQQLYKQMRDDPAYDVRDKIELQYSFVTVLAVTSDAQATEVWMYFNTPVESDVFYPALAQIAATAAQYYSSQYYAIWLVPPEHWRTVDGQDVYFRSVGYYGFNTEAMARLSDAGCTICLWNELFQKGAIQAVQMRRPCPEILRREPGYVWPWE